jgi:hypothetical protein
MIAGRTHAELVVGGFDYAPLEPHKAKQLQESASRIRAQVKKTLEDIIVVGQELTAVRQNLPHGQFIPWLKAEFGWTERTAQNFMAVAQAFGSKNEIIADLIIQPTAAYLLSAPSVPEEARLAAVQRAQAGERITTFVAKDIVAQSRKHERSRQLKSVAPEILARRLRQVLQTYKARCRPKHWPDLARLLREFAEGLEKCRQVNSRQAKTPAASG